MITREQFRMVELLSRSDIEEHPVWADFHDSADRRRVLGWGVDEDALDAELHKYDYCGRSPLYPVLDADDAPCPDDLVNPSIGLRFLPGGGSECGGYRVGQNAFVVFVGDREYCFNTSLAARWDSECEKLAAALALDPATLFPLEYRELARFGAPEAASGHVEAPDESR